MPSGRETAPVGPGGGFTITERAESAPITALAVKPPFLWAAGAAGLRRFDVDDGRIRSGRRSRTTPARARSPRSPIDDDGAAWVAGAAGIGRWVAAGDDLRYEPKGTPGAVNVHRAAPAGGDGRASGRAGRAASIATTAASFPASTASATSPVSSIVLDDDGKGAWVGTHKHGLYHAEGDHAAPVPGGEAIFLDAVLGVAKTAAGTRARRGERGTASRGSTR